MNNILYLLGNIIGICLVAVIIYVLVSFIFFAREKLQRRYMKQPHIMFKKVYLYDLHAMLDFLWEENYCLDSITETMDSEGKCEFTVFYYEIK